MTRQLFTRSAVLAMLFFGASLAVNTEGTGDAYLAGQFVGFYLISLLVVIAITAVWRLFGPVLSAGFAERAGRAVERLKKRLSG